MRKILIFFPLLILFLFSCGGNRDQTIKPPSTNEEAIQTYQDALNSLKSGDYFYDSKKFSEVKFLYRKLDQFSWQYCNKGFFNFKNYIPKIIQKFN